MRKTISKIVSTLLIALLVLCFSACTPNTPPETPGDLGATATATVAPSADQGPWANAKYKEDTSLGEGANQIILTVKVEENSVKFTINSDKTKLGEILLDNELVQGEQGAYGLYIKYVNGIRADYELDKAYWEITKDGEMVNSGADSIEILSGDKYELTYKKA